MLKKKLKKGIRFEDLEKEGWGKEKIKSFLSWFQWKVFARWASRNFAWWSYYEK